MNILIKNKFWLIIDGLLIIVIAVILFTTGQDSNLIITRSAISIDNTGKQIISGTVENKTSDKTYSKVRVDIKYLNTNNQVVGKDALQTNSLGPHMVWGFKAEIIPDNVVKFQTKVSSVHNFGLRW